MQVDDEIAEYFLNEQQPPKDVLKAAIRRNVVRRTFSPVSSMHVFVNPFSCLFRCWLDPR